MNKFLITSFLLILGNSIYAAQANKKKIQITITPVVTENGRDQRIMKATLGKFFYKKIITCKHLWSRNGAQVQCEITSNCNGDLRSYLETYVTIYEQGLIMRYLSEELNMSLKSVSTGYFNLRDSITADSNWTAAQLQEFEKEQKDK